MIPPDLARVALCEAIRRIRPDWPLHKVVLLAPFFHWRLRPALRARREFDEAMRRVREIMES